MDQGFIKLFRKFKTWEWYKNSNVKSLFVHLLLSANYQDNKWQGITIKRGQLLTSINSLHYETGLSKQQVRTALDKLILTNEITNSSTNKYRIITVLKYNEYQINNKQDNKPLTINQHSNNNQVTTNKNSTNLKNIKNVKKKEEKKLPPKTLYLDFVLLTDDEHSKLKELLGKNIGYYIESLNNYIGTSGKEYKSHYFAIRSFYKRDKEQYENELKGKNLLPEDIEMPDWLDNYIKEVKSR